MTTAFHKIKQVLLFFIAFILPACLLLPGKVQGQQGKTPENRKNFKMGEVTFKTDADTLYLYIDKNYRQLKVLTDDKTIRLPAGYHTFFVFGKDFPEHESYFEVKSDTISEYTIPPVGKKEFRNSSKSAAYARLKWEANLLVETDRETEIWIEGKFLGKGVAKATLPGGTYQVQFKDKGGQSQSKLVTVESHRLNYVTFFFLPSRKLSRIGSVLPAFAQFHKKQYIKAGAIVLLTGLSVTAGIINNSRAKGKIEDFNETEDFYNRIKNNEDLGIAYGERLETINYQIQTYHKRRNLFYTFTGVLYVLNILDAIITPKSGFRRTNTLLPFRNITPSVGSKNVNLSVKLEF